MTSILSEPAQTGADAMPAQPQAPQSAGAALRAARQRSGLHIAALAVMLKVPQAKLEALETDRWQDLPDMTFARALAKSMCRALKVDADTILRLLPSGPDKELHVSRGLNTPYREHANEGVSLAWLGKPVVLSALALLVAAALVYFVPSDWLQNLRAVAPDTATSHAVEPMAVEAPVVASQALSAVPGASSLPVAQDVPGAQASASEAIKSASPAVSAVPAPSTQTSSIVPTPAAGQVPMRVKVSAESWVEVVDAKGQVLLSRLMRPGDDQNMAGTPPFKIRVGNVAATEMTLRGVAVDLKGPSRDNVARIELN
ncbi:helix-turn-helix domain-containing protein [Roseateles koreensis]|uniref:Helix-turn-helix domain-containing protein n=1 Tax=Roseateles koreensis TaxID=2987526 RepID=A0ABT5KLD4_9BURK|nr:helix-turn-helix domain-containing protein [Roseateles koreensis]MDC8783657.1 helix-turn-helix domain-containing protein [Roseateles koreensis]